MGLGRLVKKAAGLANPFGGTKILADMLGGGDVQQSSAGNLLEQISAQYFNQTDPVRKQLIDRSNKFLTGNLDVTQSPVFGQLKLASDQQFSRARDNVLASMPSGGALSEALVGLEGEKASNMTNAIGSLANEELNRAFGFVNPQASMSGLGMAGQLQNQTAMDQSQQKGAAKQGVGQGVGMLAATKSSRSFKCDNQGIDTSVVLEKVCGLPVEKWKYIGDDVSHIGTYAEEFSKAFGGSDKSIDTATAVGVLMASIQELTKRILYLEKSRV